MKFSSRVDRSIGTEWDQDNRNKTSTKKSSSGEGMDRREANTTTNFTKVQTILMFNEPSP